MEQLKAMKQCLEGCVQGQVFDLKNADYHELGAAVDMIKDLSEAIYYCTITEAMEEKEEGKETHYYTHTLPYLDYNRDMDKTYGRMYYNGNGGSMNYTEHPMTHLDMRDSREGRSPMSRRMYMETKQMHQPKEVKMKELEKYLQELGQDITEMIVDASPEEKALMQ